MNAYNEELVAKVAELEEELKRKNDDINKLMDELVAEKHKSYQIHARYLESETALRCIVGTRSYQVFAKYMQKPMNLCFRALKKVYRLLKALVTLNFKGLFDELAAPFKWRLEEKKRQKAVQAQLEEIRNAANGKTVIVCPPTIDWNMPMYQRPQQLAVSYATKPNTFVVYLTPNSKDDHVEVLEKVSENLWIVNKDYAETLNTLLTGANKIIVSLAWATNEPYANILKYDKLIYDFIDDLEIYGDYNEEVYKAHYSLLEKSDVTVCTATKLYEKVLGKTKNPILSPNAGDYAFFAKSDSYEINPLIREEVEKYDCVIGYYGALAKWFDYELVKEVARKHPNWLFVLVGIDYDGSLDASGARKFENVIHVPPQPYKELPSFLKAFDIATIPFVINEITLGTSPVKIFEYMAAGKPIIASPMPECMKYDSVKIYESPAEFSAFVENFLEMKDDDAYWDVLKTDALNNTWDARTDQILQAIS